MDATTWLSLRYYELELTAMWELQAVTGRWQDGLAVNSRYPRITHTRAY